MAVKDAFVAEHGDALARDRVVEHGRLVAACCNVAPEDALRAATSSPARLLNMASIGHLQVGHQADINGLDSSLRVVKTLRRLQSVRA